MNLGSEPVEFENAYWYERKRKCGTKKLHSSRFLRLVFVQNNRVGEAKQVIGAEVSGRLGIGIASAAKMVEQTISRY